VRDNFPNAIAIIYQKTDREYIIIFFPEIQINALLVLSQIIMNKAKKD